jgi:hypothetical protein
MQQTEERAIETEFLKKLWNDISPHEVRIINGSELPPEIRASLASLLQKALNRAATPIN